MLTPNVRQHTLTNMSRPDMEPFTSGVISVLALALEQAGRLGHRYFGAEHLLLAVASASHPTGAALRDHGVTPERVEQEIVRQTGLGPGAALLGGLDRDALAAIGIDLDTVRARIESSFEPDALTRAGQAAQRGPRRARLHPHQRHVVLTGLIRRWHRRHQAARKPIPLRAATGLWRQERGSPVFVPFSPGAQQSLHTVRHEARAQNNTRPDVEHVALAVIAMTDGPVPAILSSLGVTPLALRAAIIESRRAGPGG
jgi:ATP-dependent Clp protease ATP-binding subunit ClpA